MVYLHIQNGAPAVREDYCNYKSEAKISLVINVAKEEYWANQRREISSAFRPSFVRIFTYGRIEIKKMSSSVAI